MTGFFNVYKESGYTSHDVVAIVRKLTGVKTGHTGTLDPQAEGVLPICLGRATKLADMITGQGKSYVAEVVLGVFTDTGDMTGEVINTAAVCFNKETICKVVARFCGQQLQTPPMYSAIKIGGKKLYELARKGQTVERKPRLINIESIQVLELRPEKNSFVIDVKCSKGTYIRSLCMDIGAALGTVATMGLLIRTSSGDFSVDSAAKIHEIREAAAAGRLYNMLLPVEKVLPFPKGYVKPDGLLMAKNGNPLPICLVDMPHPTSNKIWLHGQSGLIGLYSYDPTLAKLRLEVML